MYKQEQPMAASVMGFIHLFVRFTLAVICACLLSGCGSRNYEMISDDAESSLDMTLSENDITGDAAVSAETEMPDSAEICVYICGAVNAPGVYRLPAGSRVYEAVAMAGGLRADADAVYVNQASPLSDGEQITVYTIEEAAAFGTAAPVTAGGGAGSAGNSAEAAGKVNINTAGAAELETLNGIGASRAQDIISYREANGSFQTIEDIMKVSGIKQSLFDRMKDRITVG